MERHGIRLMLLAALALAAGVSVASWIEGHMDPGWDVRLLSGHLVVSAIRPGGAADAAGIAAGEVVIRVDARSAGEADLVAVRDGWFLQADVVSAADADSLDRSGVIHDSVVSLRLPEPAAVSTFGVVSLLFAALLLVGSFVAGRELGADPEMSLLVGVASAAGLLVAPIWASEGRLGLPFGWLIAATTVGPLSLALASRSIVGHSALSAAAALATALMACLAGAAIALPFIPTAQAWPLIPGALMLAGAPATLSVTSKRSRHAWAPALMAWLVPVVSWLALTPALGFNGRIWMPVVTTAFAAVLGWLSVRPRFSAALESIKERDAAIGAMEAERARIAADIHDDVLQDLAGVIRHLDARGDPDGAAEVAALADRLRTICYDLRLPLLEDFGAGAAIEWLVGRAQNASDGAITLERVERARPPAEVELAIYRIAQEALTNALRHGAPPMTVRYEADVDHATLEISDRGRGIEVGVPAHGSTAGLGLLNMRQRASRIGALLEVKADPSGGTRVTLDWSVA